MKKILLSSIILSGILFANQLSYLPLDKKFLSEENGGDKPAIESYSDGIGLYTVGKIQIDNRAMNNLVFKFGEEAKKNGETLKKHALDNGNNEEKKLAEKLGNLAENIKEDKIPCDDNNTFTINDYLVDGNCLGTFVNINKPYNNFVDSYPHNTTNWSTKIENKKYNSIGQYSSKFFKLPESGYLKIKVNLTGSYMYAGITNKPSSNNWGNIHIHNPYNLANFYGEFIQIHKNPKGIYDFYIDLDNKKAYIEQENGNKIGNVFNIGTESYFGFSDHATAGNGTIEIIEVLSN